MFNLASYTEVDDCVTVDAARVIRQYRYTASTAVGGGLMTKRRRVFSQEDNHVLRLWPMYFEGWALGDCPSDAKRTI
jgi:hypothetical protein